ncbi:hypothetical protein FHW72_004142 [Ochrobactrum sp. RC6B]|nr:hypothetical protein [Ochrobactrum sp. RC6B]
MRALMALIQNLWQLIQNNLSINYLKLNNAFLKRDHNEKDSRNAVNLSVR